MLTRSASREARPFLESPIRPLNGPAVGALLLAHGGKERSHQTVGSRNGALQRMRWIGSAIASQLAEQGIAVHMMRFRYQGWNGRDADPVPDVYWAVGQLADLYGDVPLALVGHSMGGRAVVNAADAQGVVAVLGLAPWLPPTEPTGQLAGRRLLLAHGTQDRITSPRSSFEYGARARADGHEVARIVLPSSGHTLLTRARDWNRLVLAFAYSALLAESEEKKPGEPGVPGEVLLSAPSMRTVPRPRYSDVIADAFASQDIRGLQRVLASNGTVRE